MTAEVGFPGITNSSVPVLLPFDIDGFAKDITANPEQPPDKIAASAARFMRADFQPTKFFLTGPAGYDAAFALTLANVPDLSDIRYSDPVYVLFSGLAMTYQLEGPALPDGEPVKSLQDNFPGMRRYLHESYIRYSFERYGVTYVAAIYCLDTRPRKKILTCRQADRVMERFLRDAQACGWHTCRRDPDGSHTCRAAERHVERFYVFKSRPDHPQHGVAKGYRGPRRLHRLRAVALSAQGSAGLRQLPIVQQLGRL